MAASTAGKVVYEQDGVFIHSCSERPDDHDALISGIIRVIAEKDSEIKVDWKPLEDTLDTANIPFAGKDSSSVVEWTQSPRERSLKNAEHQNSYEAEWDMVNTVSFKKKQQTNGEGAGTVSSCSKWAFFFSLTDLKSIKMSKEGMGWSYLVFCLKDDVVLPALHFHHGGSNLLLECFKKYALLNESPLDPRQLLVNRHNKVLSQSFENLLDEQTFGLVQFKKDPYTTTMGGFSKVTNYIFEAFRGSELGHHQRPPSEMADLLSEAIPGLEINQQEEPGFEVITRIDLGARPDINRREPASTEEWTQSMDVEGRILNADPVKHIIFKGGLCHALRKEAWKFLLGYFPWRSTIEERKQMQKRRTDEYFRMKLQWKSISEEQEKRNSRLRDYRSLIEKDVNRTDRTNVFYEGQDNPGLILLHDILMTYCMYDFDLGYVQGMSDLLSPILYVMENEVEAFWCFVFFMDQMHHNFEEQMQGMKTQLVQLSTLLRLLDSEFCSYLESQDSGYLYFCFRWLLIRFKREFSFQDILRLWEVMWTGLPCQNFHLLVCCAILDSEKQQIMDNHYGFNEILKHINELSMKLDVEEVLCKAEAIYVQMMNCKELPQAVCEVLGIKLSNAATPDSDTSEHGGRVKGSPSQASQLNEPTPVFATNGRKEDMRHRSSPENMRRLTHA
ncbi:TBC1 domain family member 15 isoform X2 [Latimeria chalumnae]|uniref:TBC1 domain family member 15 isoform X2 n=1 Tax=Latimeria chalumnae TaxID=7897 RepID=UPI00313F201E